MASGKKPRIPRPIHNPLMTLAGATAVGHEEAASIMLPFDAMVDALRRGWVNDEPVGQAGSYLARLNRYLCMIYVTGQRINNPAMIDRAKGGLTAICTAIERRLDAGQMDKPVICTGNELRAIQSSANILAAALPHISCSVWATAAEMVADSARKIEILMGRELHEA